MTKRPTGALFYRGPSVLDGKEIVAIATTGSSNRKTGDMIQTWILRTSHPPTEAVRLGHDKSICGDCYHRGTQDRPRTCYVNVGQAPQAVYRAFKRRRYPKMSLSVFLGHRPGQPLRLGAYGDPTAVPLEAWTGLIGQKRAGYTHQWRTCDSYWRHFLMASCDSPAEAMEAARMGWRSFLVNPLGAESPPDAIQCPATTPGTTCAECALCFGAHRTAPSIWIEAHGTAKRFVGAP
jgi:hypothetical protein